MKFLHLSDLHLGKRIYEVSMLEDQRYILEQILALAEAERPDGVLIAGDIYDKAVPSADAVRLCDEFLTGLADRGFPVFVVSGNHDSAERLAFGARLMSGRNVYISPAYSGTVEPVCLRDAWGELRVWLLPFLKPATVRHALAGAADGENTGGGAGHAAAADADSGAADADTAAAADADSGAADADTAAEPDADSGAADADKAAAADAGSGAADVGTAAGPDADGEAGSADTSAAAPEQNGAARAEIGTYQEALEAAVARLQVDRSQRNVLVAHQFVTGASRCESEEFSIGGLDNVDASVFDAFDYAALGHIHSPQHVGRAAVRYCGTPLKYSFSESGQEKSVTVVELKEKGNVTVKTIPLVPLRDMRRVRGSYLEVTARPFYENTNTEDYIQVTLTDEEDVPDGMQKLRVIYPNLMRLEYDNRRTRENRAVEVSEEEEEKSGQALFAEFYELQNNQPMSKEQAAVIGRMFEALEEGEKR